VSVQREDDFELAFLSESSAKEKIGREALNIGTSNTRYLPGYRSVLNW